MKDTRALHIFLSIETRAYCHRSGSEKYRNRASKYRSLRAEGTLSLSSALIPSLIRPLASTSRYRGRERGRENCRPENAVDQCRISGWNACWQSDGREIDRAPERDSQTPSMSDAKERAKESVAVPRREETFPHV